MRIALLVFGQFRSAEEILETNLKELKKALPDVVFDTYILTDKKSQGNYSTELESYVKKTLQDYSFSIKQFEYWESMTDCYAMEDTLSDAFLKEFPISSLQDPRQHFNARLWFRRYILWKLFEQSPEYKSYDFCMFARIFDTEIISLRPMQEFLNRKETKQQLMGVIDTMFIGTQEIMKKLFQFGAETQWKEFVWSPEFTNAFAGFHSLIAGLKHTFCSEVQIFKYIFPNLSSWQNIRWDHHAEVSPSHNEAYFIIKFFRGLPIPKKILQIAIGDYSIPMDLMKPFLLRFNYEYEHIFYTDKEILEFLQSHFPQYINLYNTLQNPKSKSVMIRYLYLYKFGGWYIDIEVLPLLYFTTIYEKTYNSKLVMAKGDTEITNGFIGAVKGNPIFLELVEKEEFDNSSIYSVVKNQYTMELYENNKGLFLFKEIKGEDGKYYISYKDEVIALSKGHGYPHNFLDQLK